MKAQTAIEFLTTYSFALIIISIIILVAVIIATSNGGANELFSTCSIQPQLPCQESVLAYGSSSGNYIVIFTNNLDYVMSFSPSALNVTTIGIGAAGQTHILGNCNPAIAAEGARIVCGAQITGGTLLTTGTYVTTPFKVSYQLCTTTNVGSCSSSTYQSTGYSTQVLSPLTSFGLYNVTIQSIGGTVFINGVQYPSGTSAGYMVGANYIIAERASGGYYFSSWSWSGNSLTTIANTLGTNTILHLAASGTLIATFNSIIPTTSTTSTTTTVLVTSTSVYYEYVTLINSQSSATPNPFQQMVFFNPSTYSPYESNDLGNIRFYSGTSPESPTNELHSWCESGCNSIGSNAVFWVNLANSIPANSPFVLNMTFQPTSGTSNEYDSNFAGEAPQVSNTYGLFDNGANVFSSYFNGNTPSSKFVVPSCAGSWTQNSISFGSNTIIAWEEQQAGALGGNCAVIYNSQFSNTPTIVESSFKQTGNIGVGVASAMDTNTGALSNAITTGTACGFDYFYQAYVSSGAAGAGNCYNTLGSASTNWLYGTLIFYGTSVASFYSSIAPQLYYSTGGYSDTLSETAMSGVTKLYIGVHVQSGTNHAIIYFNWMRARAYPPSGVMPSVSFSQTTSTTSTTTSTTTTTTSTSIHYLYLTVSNQQSTATNAPFQQMVFFNAISYNSYESSGLGNIRFYSSNSPPVTANELYSWCESGCNTTASNSVFWIKLPSGIGANTNSIINMTFNVIGTAYDGNYAGEAPQLAQGTGYVSDPVTSFSTNSEENDSSSGPGGLDLTNMYIPGTYRIAFCVAGDGNGGLNHTSYVQDASDPQAYSAVGHQTSNTCYADSDSQDLVEAGISLNVPANYKYTTYAGYADDTQGSLTLSYNVPTTSFVVLLAACGYYGCSSAVPPGGCTSQQSLTGGDTYETAYVWTCNAETPGSYNLLVDISSQGGISAAAYVFANYSAGGSYGKYDNGNSIFNFYDGFIGSALSSKWTAPAGASGADYVISNGLELLTTNAIIKSTSNPSGNFILEDYYYQRAEPSNGWDFGIFSSSASAYGLHPDNIGTAYYYYNNGYTFLGGSTAAGNFIEQITNNAGSITGNVDNPTYSDVISASFTNGLSNAPITFGRRFDGGIVGQTMNVLLYWTRTRAYPPGGVMPSFSFGSVH